MKYLACALLLCACDPRVTRLGAYQPDAGAEAGSDTDASVEPGRYVEAESGALSGYRNEADERASAGEFIIPPSAVTSETSPGSARAVYEFELSRDATYRIWVRMRGPDVDHNRFWFQLDATPFRKMRLSTGEAWFWNGLHDDTDYDRPIEFALKAGMHTLRIANCVDSVGIDRLFITSAGDKPVGDDTPCSPPHSIERGGVCIDSCGSHGKTDCGRQVCQGKTVVEAYDCELCCVLE